MRFTAYRSYETAEHYPVVISWLSHVIKQSATGFHQTSCSSQVTGAAQLYRTLRSLKAAVRCTKDSFLRKMSLVLEEGGRGVVPVPKFQELL